MSSYQYLQLHFKTTWFSLASDLLYLPLSSFKKRTLTPITVNMFIYLLILFLKPVFWYLHCYLLSFDIADDFDCLLTQTLGGPCSSLNLGWFFATGHVWPLSSPCPNSAGLSSLSVPAAGVSLASATSWVLRSWAVRPCWLWPPQREGREENKYILKKSD